MYFNLSPDWIKYNILQNDELLESEHIMDAMWPKNWILDAHYKIRPMQGRIRK